MLKHFFIFAAAVFLTAGICSCKYASGDSPDYKPEPNSKKAKTERQKNWLAEQFSRKNRVSSQDLDTFHNDDFEVYPGISKSRSQNMDVGSESFTPFFWE